MSSSPSTLYSALQIEAGLADYEDAKEGLSYWLVTLNFNDYSIHDPRVDVNGFTPMSPSAYGLSATEVESLVRINTALIALQNEAVDSVAEKVQDLLGVKNGDFAGYYFSDDRKVAELAASVGKPMAQYAAAEMEFQRQLSLKAAPANKSRGMSM